jgi:hypothetical protein
VNQRSLQARVQRLEDLEAIKDLMARYASYVNTGWNDEVVDVDKLRLIYTQDVEWITPERSTPGRGLDNLLHEVRELTAPVDFSMHSLTNPVLAIDGDTATGTWLMSIASRTAGPTRQSFLSMDLAYRRTPQGWRICRGNLHYGAAIPPMGGSPAGTRHLTPTD